jgi:hypothetical protein
MTAQELLLLNANWVKFGFQRVLGTADSRFRASSNTVAKPNASVKVPAAHPVCAPGARAAARLPISKSVQPRMEYMNVLQR